MNIRDVFINHKNSLVKAIVNSDTTEQREHLRALESINHEHEIVSRIEISSLEITNDIQIDFGEVSIPITIQYITGSGNITFKNTVFKKPLFLNHLSKSVLKKIEFVDCNFSQPLQIIDCNRPNLKFFFKCENPTKREISVELQDCNLRSVHMKNCNLKGFTFNGDSTFITYISIRECNIQSNFLEKISFLKNLKALSLKDIIYEEGVFFQNAKSTIDFRIFGHNILFQENVENRSKSLQFSKSLILTECNFSNGKSFILNHANLAKTCKLDLVNADEIEFAYLIANEDFNFSSRKSNLITIRQGQFNRSEIKVVNNNDLKMPSNTFNGDCHFEDCQLNTSSFAGCNFNKYVSFKRSRFAKAPDFLNASYTHSTTFYGCKFDDVMSKESEGRYRVLKDQMRSISNDSDDILFSSYELQSRQKELWKSDKSEFILSLCYLLANQYGRSILRPLWCILTVWFVFALIFFSTDSIYVEISQTARPLDICFEASTQLKPYTPPCSSFFSITDISWATRARTKGKTYQSAVFSGINMLGPLRLVSFFEGFKVKTFTYVMLTWLQSILATILWYLFIVGIKRRFRTG